MSENTGTHNKLLLCTGPPSDNRDDGKIASIVAGYEGNIIICGGITAQIISRELSRELTVNLRDISSDLPPTSSMAGVNLITEGVLTLGKVKRLLEYSQDGDIIDTSPAGQIARMMLAHDTIDFVVGTCINPAYLNFNLPIKLELREDLVKSIVRLLKTKFSKKIKVKYI